jgi:membrane protease YdiL (CAAX protease family)
MPHAERDTRASFAPAPSAALPPFARRFGPLWLLGVAGVLSLLLLPLPAPLQASPAAQALSPAVLAALLLVNPLLLVTAGAALGAALAHRVGIASAIAGTHAPRLAAPSAIAIGFVLALGIVALDHVLEPALGPQWTAVRAAANASPVVPSLVAGMLYGGIAEELVMRWGLMSLCAWLILRVRRRTEPSASDGRPGALVVRSSIVIANLAFAAGHLPVLLQQVDPTVPVVLRTLALNGAAGLVYGWLCWRRSLESAMLAHAATHAGFALARFAA